MSSQARPTRHTEHSRRKLVTDILFLRGEVEAQKDRLLYGKSHTIPTDKEGAGALLPVWNRRFAFPWLELSLLLLAQFVHLNLCIALDKSRKE